MPWVQITNITGPPGPPGSGGGGTFVHTQSTPSASWVVNHNLNSVVSVQLIINGKVEYTDIDHGSPNQSTLTFPSPETGTAVFQA